MPERTSFFKARVIIAEGEEDAAFSRAVRTNYADTLSEFDISPVIDIGKVGGNTGFKRAIIRADALDGFENVTDVVIIADNDDDPTKALASIVKQIKEAKAEGDLSRNWAIPTAPEVKEQGDPSVSIWLWPATAQNGCLETLLWQYVQGQRKYDIVKECINQAVRCTTIDDWPLSKLDKARIRCFIALYLRADPERS